MIKKRTSFTSCFKVDLSQIEDNIDFTTLKAGKFGDPPFTKEKIDEYEKSKKAIFHRSYFSDDVKDTRFFIRISPMDLPPSSPVEFKSVSILTTDLGRQLSSIMTDCCVKKATLKATLKVLHSVSAAGSVNLEGVDTRTGFDGIIESSVLFTDSIENTNFLRPNRNRQYLPVVEMLGLYDPFLKRIDHYEDIRNELDTFEKPFNRREIQKQFISFSGETVLSVMDIGVELKIGKDTSVQVEWEFEGTFYAPCELKKYYEELKKTIDINNPWNPVIARLKEIATEYKRINGISGNWWNYALCQVGMKQGLEIPLQMVICGLAEDGKSSLAWCTQIAEKGVYSEPKNGLNVRNYNGIGEGSQTEKDIELATRPEDGIYFVSLDIPGKNTLVEILPNQFVVVVIDVSRLFTINASKEVEFQQSFDPNTVPHFKEKFMIVLTKWDKLYDQASLKNKEDLLNRSENVWTDETKQLERKKCIELAKKRFDCPVYSVKLPVLEVEYSKDQINSFVKQMVSIWDDFLCLVLKKLKKT